MTVYQQQQEQQLPRTVTPSPSSQQRQDRISSSTASSPTCWWHSSIVRRSYNWVMKDVTHVVSNSQFLQTVPPKRLSVNDGVSSDDDNDVALLHRDEILTGSRIGRGGFSDVFEVIGFQFRPEVDSQLTASQQLARRRLADKCLNARTGKPRYAVKQLQEKLLSNGKRQENFAYATSDLAVECAYLSRFDHPNVIKVRGLPVQGIDALHEGRHDGFFLLMDRVDDTLDNKIQWWKEQQQQNEGNQHQQESFVDQKLEIALQLVRALEYLHSKNILFRDLKPQNIGLIDVGDGSQTPRVVLLDFGLCRELPREPEQQEQGSKNGDGVFHMSGVGTRRYMSPEIINSSRYNAKADVYGWSMVVWEMLALERPYPTYSVEDHRVHVCQQGERPSLTSYDEYPSLRYVPEAVKNLLKACWTDDVSTRYTTKEASCVLYSIVRSNRILSSLRTVTSSEPEGCYDAPDMVTIESNSSSSSSSTSSAASRQPCHHFDREDGTGCDRAQPPPSQPRKPHAVKHLQERRDQGRTVLYGANGINYGQPPTEIVTCYSTATTDFMTESETSSLGHDDDHDFDASFRLLLEELEHPHGERPPSRQEQQQDPRQQLQVRPAAAAGAKSPRAAGPHPTTTVAAAAAAHATPPSSPMDCSIMTISMSSRESNASSFAPPALPAMKEGFAKAVRTLTV